MNRRELLGGVAAALVTRRLAGENAAAYASTSDGGLTTPQKQQADASPLRVGVIGPGSRGKELIRHLLHVPGVEIVAVADVYAPRFAEVNQLVGHPVPATKDYRELLERKDLDAVVVASPLFFHAEHVLGALRSGRPVYGEKSMAFTPEQCQEILTEAKKPDSLYQVGHEYRYAPWVQEAVRKVHSGAIGEPTHVYGYWHRNNSWRRPVPNSSLEHLINWRLYRESSGGLVTELGSHQIDIANWVFGAQPIKTLGTTSIVKWHDGRTVGDNVQATFNYPEGRRLFFSALTDNAKVGNDLWIYGTEGSIQVTIEDATIYYEPKTTTASHVSPDAVAHGILTGASYSTKGEMPYRGPGERLQAGSTEDPTFTATYAFIQCVRKKEQPQANADVAFASGVASACANKAVNTEQLQSIPLPA